MNHCVRHYEEPMAATCRSCKASFCGRCLVYAFGPKKPPFCIGCALNAGGIRPGYQITPVVSAATDRRVAKAEKQAAKAAAKAAKAASKGRRGRRHDEQAPQPVAAGPIPFDDRTEQHEEHDARVPATAQLASLMRKRAGEPAGQPI